MVRRVGKLVAAGAVGSLLAVGLVPSTPAGAVCATSSSVATQAQLTEAINCFTAQQTGSYTVEITADITYTEVGTFINGGGWPTTLIINGNGHTIDADGNSGTVGGVFDILNATVEINGLTLTGGSAAEGGAIAVGGPTTATDVTITDSTITGNVSSNVGGGIHVTDGGELHLVGSTVSGNQAPNGGGLAISDNAAVSRAQATITNSTISGNTATGSSGIGGGIQNGRGILDISFSTITANTAEGFSGFASGIGAFATTAGQSPTTITASIVADNVGTDIQATNGSEIQYTSGGYNVIGDGFKVDETFTEAGDTYDDVAALEALADNGGPTLTHMITGQSPALDRMTAASMNDVDQRGIARPQGPARDSGAVEFVEPNNEGAVYVPVSPCRLVDTRLAGGALGNREIRDYAVRGSGTAFAAQGGLAGGCGVPAEAAAVEASVTAVSPSTGGFFRAWPGDESMPNATFMNMAPGQDITNTGAIALAAGAPSDLKVRNFGGATQYVIDVQGYFIDPVPEGSVYVPMTPCRIVDSRQAGGAFANREIRDYAVRGSGAAFVAQGGLAGGCGVPAEAAAVEASVTAVSPSTGGFFRAWPGDESMPNATFMNMAPGRDITNTGSVALATSGPSDLKVRNFGGATQYVIDVQGYFIDPAIEDGAVYRPVSPCRVVDSRLAGGAFANREIRTHQVAGSGAAFASQGGLAGGCGLPDSALADGAIAVEASVTAVSPAVGGFFRAWPAGESMPNATFMNMAPGQDITNTGSLALGGNDLTVRNFGGSSQYVIDLQGYFVPQVQPV